MASKKNRFPFVYFVDGQSSAKRAGRVDRVQLLPFNIQRYRRSTEAVFMSSLLLSQMHQHDSPQRQGALLHSLLEAYGAPAAGHEARKPSNVQCYPLSLAKHGQHQDKENY